MAHVLVVEDDADIRASLVRALRERGHTVTNAPDGLGALKQIVENAPDIVLLDLGLPDIDGHQVLIMLRAIRATPVIVVTARDDDQAVVRALDAGADDYVVKPFAIDRLEARIRAVLRRAAGEIASAPYVVGDLVIDPATRTTTLAGRTVDLTRREFDLLAYLARRAGEVVPKRDILTEVWQEIHGGAERTVDVHLSWLRRKLGETAADPVYLHSVRGVGVRLARLDLEAR